MINYYVDRQLLARFKTRGISKHLELEILIALHSRKYTYMYVDDLPPALRIELHRMVRGTS